MTTPTIPRDPITTHVLDSTTGLPAPSIPVTLTLLSPPSPPKTNSSSSSSSTTTITNPIIFTARTSSDGRITHWTPHTSLQAAHSSSPLPSPSPSPSQSSLQKPPLPSLPEIFSQLQERHKDADGDGGSDSRRTVWSLKFETVDYWGGEDKTFYPEVEVRFFVDARREEGQGGKEKEKHWHVPVLLGPWGYTTYRGS